MYLHKTFFFSLLLTISFFGFNNTSYAQGPPSPEAVGFEPVDATDMVNLTNGNLAYVLPLMEIDGFPVNLSYHAGITPNLEASWVGLGWYLNPGAINRAANGTPDDWKEGVGISFTSFSETKEYYSITAGVGVIGTPVNVGVGAHWGGGQGLSGSIQANLGVVSGYADTNGNASVGINLGFVNATYATNGKPKYNAVVSQGYSWEGGNDNSNSVGASYSTDGTASVGYSGAKGSLGISFSGGGDFSVGGATAKGVGASFSSSSSSSSQGDATIDTKSMGMSVTVPVGPISISLGFRTTKVKISILKGYVNTEWGALYASEFTDIVAGEAKINNITQNKDGFTDYMNRDYKVDSYSTRLPQSEQEFIGDYSKTIENINFTFIAYDDYNVSAQGMMGSLTPRVFQNANVIGKGGRTENIDEDPIHIFWHHGASGNSVQRSLTNSSKPFEFYFDGQYTRTEKNSGHAYNTANLSNLTMNNFLTEGGHSGQAIGANRAHQGNYVEVYTNQQIANGQANGLITPKDIPNSSRNNTALFDPNGIGAYKITAVDGKTYHFALPVYHYEMIQRNQMERPEYRPSEHSPYFPLYRWEYDCEDVNEVRQYTRYATHWLLTAITAPDYVDIPDPDRGNALGTFNKEDYGYWIELEYGKWSDGYVWRSPYQDFVYDYNTNILDEVLTEDKGHYSFGRKQVYYLDRINSRNRSALFVKDIRYDGFGKELTYRFMNKSNQQREKLGNSGNNTSESSLNFTEPEMHVKEPEVYYKREYSLLLDKIVLVDAEDADLVQESGSSNLGGSLPNNYIPNDTNSPGWASPYFEDHYGQNYQYAIHQETNVLDVRDLPQNFVEDHALNVVNFNHGYSLVRNTPSSMMDGATYGGNNSAARLTLNSVEFLGRGGSVYMPATTFEYYDSSTIENPNFQPIDSFHKKDIEAHLDVRKGFVDAWGYMQDEYTDAGKTYSRAQLWSLKNIGTATGATININYEEDDYWTEAFSRRYWEENLKIKVVKNLDQNIFEIYIENLDGLSEELITKFDDYFMLNERVFIDLWICIEWNKRFGGRETGTFNLIGEDYYCTVKNVSRDEVKIVVPMEDGLLTGNAPGRALNKFFARESGVGSANYRERERGICNLSPGPGGTEHTVAFKLLANKVPENEVGGGLRVKEVVTTDGISTYRNSFDYRHPSKNRSSGITSYAPIDGLKFVPYQSEVPPPGVMYEYVTVKETDNFGKHIAATRYQHHVLKPVFDIFNPEIEFELLDSEGPEEDQLFWVDVTDNNGGLNGNNPKKVEATKIDVNINTALFGQVKSIEVLNPDGHLMNKTTHEYSNGRLASVSDTYKGYVKETFNSLKTIFVSNEDGTSVVDSKTKRLLSISSKTEYKNMLKKTRTLANGNETYVEYYNRDPWLNTFRDKQTKHANGNIYRTSMFPAYEYYEDMRSKALDSQYKNMLTQEAMKVRSVKTGSSWKTTSASVSTWKNGWSYLNDNGSTSSSNDIWRKHANYIWKGNIDANGTLGRELSPSDFNWGIGAIQDNEQWQKISEVTLYNRNSLPVETKDINDNYASSKLIDNNKYIEATGNARYTEMFYTGGEHYNVELSRFAPQIRGNQSLRYEGLAHTGNYSIKITPTDNTFGAVLHANKHRAGKYKVSVWIYKHNHENARFKQGYSGGLQEFNGEKVFAGDFVQLNHYFDRGETQTQGSTIFMVASASGDIYIDDFRMHPVYASMNSFVYDQGADELLYVLDANNMGTQYCYDLAGRLCRVYKEVAKDDGGVLYGGFELINEYEYHYDDVDSSIEQQTCKCADNQIIP